MSLFQIPVHSHKSYVYAVVCQDNSSDPIYVKFGRSVNIYKRLLQVCNSCPIPARYFAVLEVLNDDKMVEVEKALHAKFDEHRTSGEWFRFANDKYGKELFNSGCKEVFSAILRIGSQSWWEKIPAQAIIEYSKRRKKSFIKSKQGKRHLARKEFNRKLVPKSER